MPSAIIPPGFAQVFIRFTVTGDNEEMLTSIGVRLQAGVTDPVAVAAELSADWQAAWLPSTLGTGWTCLGARAYLGSDGDYPVGEGGLTTAGTSATAKLPNNCALLGQKQSGLTGRRNRGRMFIPSGYLSEGSIDEAGYMSAGDQTTFSGRMENFRTSIEAGTSYDRAVILHSSSPTTPTVITKMSVSRQIATQRTRMRR